MRNVTLLITCHGLAACYSFGSPAAAYWYLLPAQAESGWIRPRDSGPIRTPLPSPPLCFCSQTPPSSLPPRSPPSPVCRAQLPLSSLIIPPSPLPPSPLAPLPPLCAEPNCRLNGRKSLAFFKWAASLGRGHYLFVGKGDDDDVVNPYQVGRWTAGICLWAPPSLTHSPLADSLLLFLPPICLLPACSCGCR